MKGSGVCNQRNILSLTDNNSDEIDIKELNNELSKNINKKIIKNIQLSPEEKFYQRMLEIDDIDKLEELYENNDSYIEQLLVLHRISTLQENITDIGVLTDDEIKNYQNQIDENQENIETINNYFRLIAYLKKDTYSAYFKFDDKLLSKFKDITQKLDDIDENYEDYFNNLYTKYPDIETKVNKGTYYDFYFLKYTGMFIRTKFNTMDYREYYVQQQDEIKLVFNKRNKLFNKKEDLEKKLKSVKSVRTRFLNKYGIDSAKFLMKDKEYKELNLQVADLKSEIRKCNNEYLTYKIKILGGNKYDENGSYITIKASKTNNEIFRELLKDNDCEAEFKEYIHNSLIKGLEDNKLKFIEVKEAENKSIINQLELNNSKQEELSKHKEAVRNYIPKFTKQNLNEIEKDLKNNKGFQRAIFIKDSPLQDNILYSNYDGENLILENKLDKTEDEKYYDLLKSKGAVLVENKMELPTYNSWAKVDPGHKVVLETEDYEISYIPYNKLAQIEKQLNEYQSIIHLKNHPQKDNIRKQLEKKIKEDYQPLTKGAIKLEFSYLSPTYYEEVTTKVNLTENETQWIYPYGNISYKDLINEKGNLKTNYEIKKTIQAKQYSQSKNPIKTIETKIIDKEELTEGWEFKDGKLIKGSGSPTHIKINDEIYPYTTSKSKYEQKSGNEYIKRLKAVKQLFTKKDPIIVDHQVTSDIQNYKDYKEYKLENSIIFNRKVRNIKGIQNETKRIITSGLLDDHIDFKYTNEKVLEDVIQAAPLSEKGKLEIKLKKDIKLKDIKDILKENKLANKIHSTVPYDLVYRGEHNKGKVLPQLKDYATKSKAFKLPENYMVIHGMTGTNNINEAYERLEKIVNYGGLKSIAERRRLATNVHSMSPLGDIASGIDEGVPCKIGDAPSYGKNIFFVMKPEILKRRDLWFSNKDFGGGHNRYNSYDNYAKSLGQDSFHSSPSHEARQKHFDSGVKNYSHNEVYFKHEIPLDEISYVLVNNVNDNNLENKIKELLKDTKIKVKTFDYNIRDVIKNLEK